MQGRINVENQIELSRRGLLAGSAALASFAVRVPALAAPARQLTLVSQPVRIFKATDAGHERTESWYLYLIGQTPDDQELVPDRLRIELFSAGKLAKVIDHVGPGLQALIFPTTGFKPALPDGGIPAAPLFWPFLVRLRLSEPIGSAIDSMRVVLEASESHGRKRRAVASLAIETYSQKTALMFPFRGKGMIGQAGVGNGGHRNRSGQFALDAMGLSDSYAPMVRPGPGNSPDEFSGWGRTLIAPADGTIMRARGDRPDQPDANSSDPKYFAPEFPRGGDPGNHVVIDHSNGEFSLIAHLQAGSVLPKLGDRIRQGDPIGKLGASGDASGPHVHYQLQSEIDWQYADGLPCTFSNVAEKPLFRGTYFEAT